MTVYDYSRIRDRIARKRESCVPTWDVREIDDGMRANGYPAVRGTYRRLMGNGVPTRHLIIALARVFEITVDDLCPPQWFRDLEDCRIPSCPEHGDMIPERGPMN